MKHLYVKKLFLIIFLLSICSSAYYHFQKDGVKLSMTDESHMNAPGTLDACEQATNLMINYEMGMPVAQISWDGQLPQEGWYILYAYEGSIDINWFISDPNHFEQPEVRREKVYSSPHHIYMNHLNPGMYELYVISDCGDNNLVVSERLTFEVGERSNEEIGACEPPSNFTSVQNEPFSMDLSWEPNDGELYQIAWLPMGMEMNEDFYHNPQVGSVIVSENPYHLVFYPPGAEEARSVYIRKYCGDNRFSEWVVPQCYPPSGLESSVNDESVVFNWTPGASEFGWQLVYGPQGFDPDNQTDGVVMINTYDNPTYSVQLVTLQQGITYDFYVRAQCSGDSFSTWSGPGSFETIYIPCDPVQDVSLRHITHKSVDITWTPVSGEQQWTVVYSMAPFDWGQAMMMPINNNPKAILMGLQPSTTYEVLVMANCPSGESTPGEILSFTTTEDDPVYCIPYFLTGCYYDFIDHMIIDGENDSRIYDLNTGCTDSNYNNQTDVIIDLAPGNQYFTRLSHGNFPISGDQLAIWIDFNDDGTFDETERVGDGALLSSDFTNINFTIPEGANPGLHRMRVMLAFNAYAYQLTPCNDGESISTNGEVHDYTANILALSDCSDVSAGTPMENIVVCPGDEFTIRTLGASDPAIGLVRKWQSSPAGQNDWTDLENGSLPTTTLYTGIQQATDFRYVVTCTQSGETSISETLHVTMSTNCYCVQNSNCAGPGGLQINHVTLMGETIAIDNPSGCGGNGYSNFLLEFPPDLKRGESYELFVTANNVSLSDGKIKAWIDYNGNNVFENNEAIMDFPSGVPGYTVSSNFVVPMHVYAGTYRMRIRVGWWGSPTLTGCSVLGDGETEDYLVEILPNESPQDCPEPTGIIIAPGSTPATATVSWTPGGIETKWEVVYGFEGFDPDAATPILVNNNPVLQLNGLEQSTTYEVYVRALCQGGETGDWSEPKKFTTADLGITDANFERFTYFPVPTDNTLNLKSHIIIDEVVIFDSAGQKVLMFKPLSKDAALNISKLSSGVYFMKVNLNGSTRIFKILKK